MKTRHKPLMMVRNVKTKQQVHREVELKGATFQRIASWQSEYKELTANKKG